MSGTPARPAAGFSLPRPAIGAANARRLGAAALAVVALHVGILTLRPGAASGNFVPPSAPAVMAVRMVMVPPAPSLPPVALPTFPPAAATLPPAIERPLADAARARSTPEPIAVPASPAAATRSEPGERSARPAATPAASDAQDAVASLAAAPDYAFGIRLDPGPRPLDDIEPDYPDTLHLREGVVVLRLLISATGHVDDVAVVRAEPRGIFEQAAIDAFAKARFSPGLASGMPVKSQIMVEVQFMPINRGARVSGRTY